MGDPTMPQHFFFISLVIVFKSENYPRDFESALPKNLSWRPQPSAASHSLALERHTCNSQCCRESRPRVTAASEHECGSVFWKVNIAGAAQKRQQQEEFTARMSTYTTILPQLCGGLVLKLCLHVESTEPLVNAEGINKNDTIAYELSNNTLIYITWGVFLVLSAHKHNLSPWLVQKGLCKLFN